MTIKIQQVNIVVLRYYDLLSKKGKYTDVEKVRAIQTIVNRENELLNLIQAKDNLLKVKQDEFFELTDPANIAKLNELSKVVRYYTGS
jgi:hypothetical protein